MAAITPASVDNSALKRLLFELIEIYSPSGKEEQILEYVQGYFDHHSIPCVRQEVDEDRHNILVFACEPEKVEVVFVGHLDTVSAFDFDHYEPSLQKDEVRGLGAADMKGGCAAMMEAFRLGLLRHGDAMPAALALVVGEEETGDGIQALLREYRFPWAIVGEPTDLTPCLGHYGYIETLLGTIGARRHASFADQSHHAVFAMLQLLMGLTRHMEEKWGEVIFNIRDVHSREAGFAVPDRCEACLDLHVPPQFAMGQLIMEIEDIVYATEDSGNEVSFPIIHAGYQLPDRGDLPEILKQVGARLDLPWSPGVFRSDSDATFLWSSGVKPIILGPGQLARAHTRDESASFQQICKAARLYLGVLDDLVAYYQ